MISEARLFERVRTCFVEALEVDADEVQPHAKVFADLGAESVDLLDIVFRLERAFKIKIPRSGIEKRARKQVRKWTRRGVLTADALEVLRETMPEVEPQEICEGLRPRDLPRLFSVQTFVNLVHFHLEAEENTGNDKGKERRSSRIRSGKGSRRSSGASPRA